MDTSFGIVVVAVLLERIVVPRQRGMVGALDDIVGVADAVDQVMGLSMVVLWLNIVIVAEAVIRVTFSLVCKSADERDALERLF